MLVRFLLCATLLFAGCGPRVARVVEVKPTATSTPTLAPSPTQAVPPTLSPPTPVPPPNTPVPTRVLSGEPTLRNVQPVPGAVLPAGDVRVAAEVIGTTDIVQVNVYLNGRPTPSQVEQANPRHWTVVLESKLEGGEYEVWMVALDDQHQPGSYRWRFRVQPAPTGTPTPSPSPTPSATPSQTRTPTPLPPSSTATARPVRTAATAAPSRTRVVLVSPAPTNVPPTATPAPVTVPIVRGMRTTDAQAQLQRMGLASQVREVKSPAPRGIVIDQSPGDGATVLQGSMVTLLVSTGQ